MSGRAERLSERIHQIRRLRHEMNNLLMGLLGRVELLEHQPGLDAAIRERAHKMRADCRRLQRVVEELGRYARDEPDD